MRVVQRGRGLPDDAERVVDRERPLARQPLPQRLARDERHDVVEQAVAGVARIVERQDVGMGERRRDPDLAGEPVGTQRGGELGPEHLDGHLALVPEVLGQVDRGHATPAQLALERIPAREGGGEAGELGGGGHEGNSTTAIGHG
jgi:hypothetical protein